MRPRFKTRLKPNWRVPELNQTNWLLQLQQKTGKTAIEIESLIEEKTTRFGGLLSKEAALFLLAKEAGLTQTSELVQLVPINQLQNGMNRVDVFGIVKRVFAPKEFPNKTKPGTGKKASVLLADQTGEIYVTFWHHDTEKTHQIPTGAPILLRNVSVSSFNNQNQLQFGYRSQLQINPAQTKQIPVPVFEIQKTKINQLVPNSFGLYLQAQVDEIFPIKEFSRSTGETGKLQRVALTDETGEINGVAWNEKVRETENIKVGTVILLENCRAKTGWQNQTEISIDSGTRIVIVQEPEQTKEKPANEENLK